MTNLISFVFCLFPAGAGLSCDSSLLLLPWFLPSACLLAGCCASVCLCRQDGIVADESQNMQFMSNQNMKLPPSNNALPNQALGSLAGLGMQSLNSVRQVRLPAHPWCVT